VLGLVRLQKGESELKIGGGGGGGNQRRAFTGIDCGVSPLLGGEQISTHPVSRTTLCMI
jgi:hypothetical protein